MSSSEHLRSSLEICNIKIGTEVRGDISQFFESSTCTRRYKIKKIKKICFTKYNNRENSIHITGINSPSDISEIKNILPLKILNTKIHTSMSKIIYTHNIPHFSLLTEFFKNDNSFSCDNSNLHLGYFNSLILKSKEFPKSTICLFPRKAVVFSSEISFLPRIKMKLDQCVNRFIRSGITV